MDALRISAIAVACACAITGCLGTTPQEAEADRIGDDPPHGPEHNPGNDCLVCHTFAIAGTVYLRATDAQGVGGARVTMTDARDRTFGAVTNRAGNFIVERGSGGEGFTIDDEGTTELEFDPAFPVRVRVSMGDLQQEMLTSIHRHGGCNDCHRREPGADSVGRVYLEAP